MVDVSVEYESLLEKTRRSSTRKNSSIVLEKTLEQQKFQRENDQKSMLELYPDWKSGILSHTEYLTLKADIQGRIEALDTSISQLQQTVAQYAEESPQSNALRAHSRRMARSASQAAALS